MNETAISPYLLHAEEAAAFAREALFERSAGAEGRARRHLLRSREAVLGLLASLDVEAVGPELFGRMSGLGALVYYSLVRGETRSLERAIRILEYLFDAWILAGEGAPRTPTDTGTETRTGGSLSALRPTGIQESAA